jgi:hypothetical protein
VSSIAISSPQRGFEPESKRLRADAKTISQIG